MPAYRVTGKRAIESRFAARRTGRLTSLSGGRVNCSRCRLSGSGPRTAKVSQAGAAATLAYTRRATGFDLHLQACAGPRCGLCHYYAEQAPTTSQSHCRCSQGKVPRDRRNQPELIARHLAQAGLTERAIEYWRKAGQGSANAEAIQHLTSALESMQSLPEGPERKRVVLELEGDASVDGDTRVPHKASVMSSTRPTETPARYISMSASSTELSGSRQ